MQILVLPYKKVFSHVCLAVKIMQTSEQLTEILPIGRDFP